MDCPKCGKKTKVANTRRWETVVIRARYCPAGCVAFRTVEEIDTDPIEEVPHDKTACLGNR